jgi:hypothetical protein
MVLCLRSFRWAARKFNDDATIEQLEIEWTEYTWLRAKSDNPNIQENHALLRCLLTRGRELQKQLPVDGYGADVQLRNFLHRCTRHAPFSVYMPTIKSETSGRYKTYLNLPSTVPHRGCKPHALAGVQLQSMLLTFLEEEIESCEQVIFSLRMKKAVIQPHFDVALNVVHHDDEHRL